MSTQNPMSVVEAMMAISQAIAQFRGTREDHKLLQTAERIVLEFIQDNSKQEVLEGEPTEKSK